MPASPGDLAEAGLRIVGLLAAATLIVVLVLHEVERLGRRGSRYVRRHVLQRRQVVTRASAVVFAAACLLQVAVIL